VHRIPDDEQMTIAQPDAAGDKAAQEAGDKIADAAGDETTDAAGDKTAQKAGADEQGGAATDGALETDGARGKPEKDGAAGEEAPEPDRWERFAPVTREPSVVTDQLPPERLQPLALPSSKLSLKRVSAYAVAPMPTARATAASAAPTLSRRRR
jgi:hypothetical protein